MQLLTSVTTARRTKFDTNRREIKLMFDLEGEKLSLENFEIFKLPFSYT